MAARGGGWGCRGEAWWGERSTGWPQSKSMHCHGPQSHTPAPAATAERVAIAARGCCADGGAAAGGDGAAVPWAGCAPCIACAASDSAALRGGSDRLPGPRVGEGREPWLSVSAQTGLQRGLQRVVGMLFNQKNTAGCGGGREGAVSSGHQMPVLVPRHATCRDSLPAAAPPNSDQLRSPVVAVAWATRTALQAPALSCRALTRALKVLASPLAAWPGVETAR